MNLYSITLYARAPHTREIVRREYRICAPDLRDALGTAEIDAITSNLLEIRILDGREIAHNIGGN